MIWGIEDDIQLIKARKQLKWLCKYLRIGGWIYARS